jgi:Holliday junction resolvase-like predicted endonuclease
LVLCEVKAKGGPVFGDPLEMITDEKLRRLAQAGESWLAAHPESARLEVVYEAIAVREGRLQRVPLVL